MKLLLTGCAGFIGATVADLLLDQGCTVVGLDNLNDAYDVRLKRWRLGTLTGRAGFSFHRADIADREGLFALLTSLAPAGDRVGRRPPFDAVINLAARAGVRQSVNDPVVYIQANVLGSLNILDFCRVHDIEKFVLASTSSLYGANNPCPFSEDANTDRPLSPYAASKKAAEALAHSYYHLHGIDVTILRYFTVYGPAGRPDMSLLRFVRNICEGQPITVFGDGEQSRDFTYVDDIARGTIAGLRRVGFEIVNLGSDQPIKLKEAISTIERALTRKATIVHAERHPSDVLATWANIGKAARLFDWQPRVKFAEGVANLVQWYRDNRAWAKDIALE